MSGDRKTRKTRDAESCSGGERAKAERLMCRKKPARLAQAASLRKQRSLRSDRNAPVSESEGRSLHPTLSGILASGISHALKPIWRS
jgi:hypothetical protein